MSFSLETIAETRIDVEKESDILLSDRRPDIVIVFDRNGRMWILGIDQISEVL